MYGTFVPNQQLHVYINGVFRTAISRPACISSARAPRPAPRLAMSKTRLSHTPQAVNLFDESFVVVFRMLVQTTITKPHNQQSSWLLRDAQARGRMGTDREA